MKTRPIIISSCLLIVFIALYQRETIRHFLVAGNNGLSGIARIQICDVRIDESDGKPFANILCNGDYGSTVVDYNNGGFSSGLSPIKSKLFVLHYPLDSTPNFFQSVVIPVSNSVTQEKSNLKVLLWSDPSPGYSESNLDALNQK